VFDYRDCVKGLIGDHVDFEGRGNVAQGEFGVCSSCRNIATTTRTDLRLDVRPREARGEDL